MTAIAAHFGLVPGGSPLAFAEGAKPPEAAPAKPAAGGEAGGAGSGGGPGAPGTPPGDRPGLIGRIRGWLKRHHRKLWWLHSAWALTLGIIVMLVAAKGFEHARWLAVTVGGAWLLFLVFFRIFQSGARRRVEGVHAKIGFVAMNYFLKNMYQGMLFFMLPYYWKSSTWGTMNAWFPIVIGFCALIATLDIVFDHVVMRWRLLASVYYLLAIFACLNVVVPAVVPSLPVLIALMAAAGVSGLLFLSLHLRLRTLFSKGGLTAGVIVMALAMTGAYFGRRVIPPVPYYTVAARVATSVTADGAAEDDASSVTATEMVRVTALIDVANPSGGEETFFHVWRRNGQEVVRLEPTVMHLEGPPAALRLRSAPTINEIPAAPAERTGRWTVDVETRGGQIVGRAAFEVKAAGEDASPDGRRE